MPAYLSLARYHVSLATALVAGVLAVASASNSALCEPPQSAHQPSVPATQYDDWRDAGDASKPGITGLVLQMYLARAGFFMRPFTAMLDERTRGAIRDFQQASGLPASGAFNKETAQHLRDFDAALRDRPGLPSFIYVEVPSRQGRCADVNDKRCAYVEVKGSWLGEDLAPELRTNRIECDVGLGTCRDTQAEVTAFGDYLDIAVQEYEIERATSTEIVTRPLDFACVEYVLRVDRAREKVTQVRRRKTKGMRGDCSALEQRDLHMYLGDGAAIETPRFKRGRDALRFLNPPPGVVKPESEYVSKRGSK